MPAARAVAEHRLGAAVWAGLGQGLDQGLDQGLSARGCGKMLSPGVVVRPIRGKGFDGWKWACAAFPPVSKTKRLAS